MECEVELVKSENRMFKERINCLEREIDGLAKHEDPYYELEGKYESLKKKFA